MGNYNQNGINFTNVKDGGKTQSSSPIWTGQVGIDEFGGIINAVDIDWNAAELSGAICGIAQDISEDLTVSTISSTGDLIKVVAEQQAQIKALSTLVKALYVSIVGEGNQ